MMRHLLETENAILQKLLLFSLPKRYSYLRAQTQLRNIFIKEQNL